MAEAGRPRRLIRTALIGAGVLLAAIQLVPYGRVHSNPAVVKEPSWDQPSTRQLAVRACFDCHSNETRWPWYSHVAPASWLVQHDVEDGRRHLNFSEWHRAFKDTNEAAEVVLEGEMPLSYYVLLHPSAKLSPEETRALAQGLTTTLGLGPPKQEPGHEHDHQH